MKSIVTGASAMSAAEVLLKCLETEGVGHIFGVPGGAITPIYEVLVDHPKIKHVLAKDEGGASYMANGYARMRRGLGVCIATTGPGGTNALTGIAASHSDSVPVLIITGQVATRAFGRGSLQDSTTFGVDLVQIFRPVTKLSAMLPNPERMPDLVRTAIRTALTGRPGPVHLSLPVDMLKQEISCEPLTPGQYRVSGAALDQAAAAEAARLLAQAERPCMLVGSGVNTAGAWAELRALAERLHIPVATTPKAKGAFPENHPLSLGVFGFAGHSRAEAYLMSDYVDVLLVIGSSMGELSTNSWDKHLQPSRALIHVDIDASEIGKNYPVDVGVLGDAKMALREMVDQIDLFLTSRGEKSPAEKTTDPLEGFRELPRHTVFPNQGIPNNLMKPQQVVRAMQSILPEDAILCIESGNSVSWAVHYFETRQPHTFFVNMGLASMGHATAGAIGAQIAAPEKTVVALVGDAAFAMSCTEVHTAVEYDAPVVWIVLNNQGHGMVYHGERMLLGHDLGMCHFRKPLDTAGMAEALGARAFRVDTLDAFRSALEQAIAARRPCVIDAKIDPEEIPHSLARRARTVGAAVSNTALSVRDRIRR